MIPTLQLSKLRHGEVTSYSQRRSWESNLVHSALCIPPPLTVMEVADHLGRGFPGKSTLNLGGPSFDHEETLGNSEFNPQWQCNLSLRWEKEVGGGVGRIQCQNQEMENEPAFDGTPKGVYILIPSTPQLVNMVCLQNWRCRHTSGSMPHGGAVTNSTFFFPRMFQGTYLQDPLS